MAKTKSISWLSVVVFIIFMAIVSREGWQILMAHRLQGDWRAIFEVNAADQNADQVKSLRLVFYPNKTLLYEIAINHYVNAVDIGPGFTSTDTGYSNIKRSLNGTYQLKGDRVYAVFFLHGSEETPFDPFVIDDVGTDYTSGSPFVKISAKIRFVHGRLVVQGFENSPQVTLEPTHDGFANPFRFTPSERRDIALRPQVGPETTSVQTFVGDKQVNVQGRQGGGGVTKTLMDKRAIMAERARQDAESWDRQPVDKIGEPASNAIEPATAQENPPPVKETYQAITRPEINAMGMYTDEDLAGMKSILKDTAAACEDFAKENEGVYPGSADDLSRYLDHVFCDDIYDNFNYTCQFTPTGYVITAKDEIKGGTFVITRGGVVTQQ